MKYKIIPTIIAKNQNEFDEYFERIKNFTKFIQVDIMDGKFVDNKSNWFNLKLNKKFKFEAHLMVDNPDEYIHKNYKNFDVLIPNIEKVKNAEKLINFVHNKKKKIGFAINPETSISYLLPYLDKLDRVLILTVNPGRYGAKFLNETLNKIGELRKFYKKDIEVDGHIDEKTILLCKKAGANLFAVGSYIKNSKNVKKAINKLKKSII